MSTTTTYVYCESALDECHCNSDYTCRCARVSWSGGVPVSMSSFGAGRTHTKNLRAKSNAASLAWVLGVHGM